MHEDKFEKQVREKMDQLGFDPTESVWAQVDLEINRKEKRRKPIFWIFFLSGLVLAGGSTYFGLNYFTTIQKANDISTNAVNKVRDLANKDKTASPAPAAHISNGKKSGSVQPPELFLANSGTRIRTKKVRQDSQKLSVAEKGNEEQSENKIHSNNEPGNTVVDKQTTENPKVETAIADKTNKAVLTDSAANTQTAANKKQDTKKSPWTIGFTAGAGLSNINQSIFESQNQAGLLYAAYYPANSTSGPAPVLNMPSETNAGFSFSAGVSIKRNLSKRFFGSAGLVYHYYSTSIHTGTSVDSTRTVYAAFAQTASVNSFYRNGEGKKYTNQYHFIELPVNLGFQINKSQKNPIDWEAGISLAWLISTNALQFDPYTNVYFENDQLFNRIQWNAATDLMFGFPVHNHSLQFGPQFQYALTSLLKNNNSYPGHLMYFGLKCSFNL